MGQRIFSVLQAQNPKLNCAARLAAQKEQTAGGRLDIRPCRQVIIDDLADRAKARDSKSNRRKCNPKAECRLLDNPGQPNFIWIFWLAADAPLEKNTPDSRRGS
jgi:hypothetical protein